MLSLMPQKHYIAHIYLILDRCLNSNPTQVVCPSVICIRSIRGAPWDSSWSLGAETFLTFCTWSTHGPSNWPCTRDKKKLWLNMQISSIWGRIVAAKYKQVFMKLCLKHHKLKTHLICYIGATFTYSSKLLLCFSLDSQSMTIYLNYYQIYPLK